MSEQHEDIGKRRMPDNLRRFMIRMQGGKMYLPAAYRVVWFRDELGDEWGIRTTLIEGGHEAGFATVHSEIVNPEGRVIASGMKTESKQDFAAGWVEKAESGATARALALLGFGTQFLPELDEDGERIADSPQSVRDGGRQALQSYGEAIANIWEGPGQCPKCHAPANRKHGKVCLDAMLVGAAR